MDVEPIAEGLWRWTTRHPDWTPAEGGEDGWDPEVGCVYCEAGDAIVLVDPLAPADPGEAERFWRALDRDVERAGKPVAVLLTVFWHARSAETILERYDSATVWAHEGAESEIAKRTRFTNSFAPGDPLPGQVEAFEANRRGEALFWIPEHRALVAGDVFLGTPGGGVRTCPDSWLPNGVEPWEFRASLRPVLELPVEIVLLAHGGPILENGRDALRRALAT
ncbi:MAG: MBL fold metallo-hydrolase [Actinobacteria bacterium]|nr:MBL fold metallo-hydrolase [Actinomycetota bacterium]